MYLVGLPARLSGDRGLKGVIGENMDRKQRCATCRFRARYDANPTSLLGRMWRWHIKWCPGWKAYFTSLNDEERRVVAEMYGLNFKSTGTP